MLGEEGVQGSRRLLFRGWCLIVPAASAGAGIEKLNLQQGRFHFDVMKKTL